MAEFCSQCSPFGDQYDIDLFEIAMNLEPGYSEAFVCEGCNIRGVYKDEERKVYLAKEVNKEIELKEVLVETLIVS